MIGPVIFLVGAIFAMVGIVYVIERIYKSQGQTGNPSRLIRIGGIVIIIGIVYRSWFGWNTFLILGLILLGYGIFTLFVKDTTHLLTHPIDVSQVLAGTPENVSPATRKGLSRNTKIVIGCGTAIVISIGLICAGTGYFIYTLRDPGTLGIEVNHPKTVHVGESLELTLDLKNNSDTDINVQDISISPAIGGNYESILAGTIVTRTEPAMESFEAPLLKMRVYPYDQVIKSGETHKVVFYFKAVKPGEFHTDILVDLGNGKSTVWDIVIPIIY